MVYVKNIVSDMRIYPGMCFLCKRIKVKDLQMEYRKHTSLKDLAQALGVSIPTVSSALKDSPEISRELCAKAKDLAKDMNYHRSNCSGYRNSFLRLYLERYRKYGYRQRIFCDYHYIA